MLALLLALIFIFWGMTCRLTLPLSPTPAESLHIASPHATLSVIPTKAGIQNHSTPQKDLFTGKHLDSGFRRNDGNDNVARMTTHFGDTS